MTNIITRFFRWLNATLEIGFARVAYSDLYVAGAISQKEYLRLMKETDKKVMTLRREES